MRVVVVGLGKSGVAATRFCARRGDEVIGVDDQPRERLPALADLGALPVTLELGGVRAGTLQRAELIVLSPGVPPTVPAIAAARAAGVPIIGEVELACRHIRAPIVGITGTNGKSTVTSLCGAIAERTGRPSFCGGNLGTPLIEAAGTAAARPDGIVVCELSSFQLETAETLRCKAAAILNLTPDHLDRYPSMIEYGDAKARIARNMPPGTAHPVVLSADDPEVRALFVRNFGPERPACWFSTRARPSAQQGSYLDGQELVLYGPGWEERYPAQELRLVGRHNLANALAAFLLMRASGLATFDQVQPAAREFRALPHRMELVAEHHGIRYYDDSKGTNVDAVAAGLDGFPRPFALIAGGRHKGGSYAPLRRALAGAAVRGVLLIGEAAPLLEEALAGVAPVVRAAGLEEAVRAAAALCRPGDAVILSPACSSYDMFRNYEHRAEVFRAAVQGLRAP